MTKPINNKRSAQRLSGKLANTSQSKRTISPKLYSSKIIKAGALLPDTKALLSAWNQGLSVNENLQRVIHQNLLGKASRSRAKDILAIFRQRYLVEDTVALALARIVKQQSNNNTLDRILYFHSVRADSLLRDVVIELLVPHWSRGVMAIEVREIELALQNWVDAGKTSGHWGDSTVRRVTSGLLSTLRDFGVLQGAANKTIAPAYLSVHAFAYIAFYLNQHQPSGTKMLDLVDWKLFFLSCEGVERYFLEAHQHGLLEYHAAGSVTRLSFPVETLEEYANVLSQ